MRRVDGLKLADAANWFHGIWKFLQFYDLN